MLSKGLREILHYVLKGVGSNEIADALNIKQNTVSTLKSRILDKTGTNNLKELLDLAMSYHVSWTGLRCAGGA
ncbi:MAG TPA: LuxR C-terminal-related transcriptional regulator [Puia sp.]|nr:LuxR C-terminal-related transcriptional regulator [Puia sp.]